MPSNMPIQREGAWPGNEPERMFLSSVKYIGGKRHVVAEFSSGSEKYCIREEFFPKAFFPCSSPSKEELVELLSSNGLNRLSAEVLNGIVELAFPDFSSLKAASQIIAERLGAKFRIIEPERQFLIEKNWNYFDAFEFQNGCPNPLGSVEFPDLYPDFLASSLHDTIASLLDSNPMRASEIAQRHSLSRLLKVPPSSMPSYPAMLFLENVFFASGFPVMETHFKVPEQEAFTGKSSVDFSALVSIVCSRPINNIGVETIDCSCCPASSLDSKNVLSSSEVNVRFLREAFYFNSVSSAWAKGFHAHNTFKLDRVARKEEYSFSAFPVGPFHRNETNAVLLADAFRLRIVGEAEIIGVRELHRVCTKRESFLSREVNFLKSMLESSEHKVKIERNAVLSSSGAMYYYLLGSPQQLYLDALTKASAEILSALPHLLCSKNSGFFEHKTAVAIESIAAEVSSELESIAVQANSSTKPAFCSLIVDSSVSHWLFRRLSDIYKVKKPLIGVTSPA